ncbi:MAG: hypothetical protein GY792_15740 [Gammaproteobacteria bacterium]|nr:hypothetical protein [Gammaproteobacteria bacterium]
MDEQKIINDWTLATQDTIFILQTWLGLLEDWQSRGQVEPDDFMEACQQLKEAALWQWANEAGGHGIEALARAVGVQITL